MKRLLLDSIDKNTYYKIRSSKDKKKFKITKWRCYRILYQQNKR